MMDKTEALVRETLQRQTDRAPDVVGLLLRLEQQPRKSWNRTMVLAGVAAAVVLVLVAGSMLLVRPGGSGEQRDQAAAAPHGFQLTWQPHWMPDGMTEKVRDFGGPHSGGVRTWVDGVVDASGSPQGPAVSLFTQYVDQTFTGGSPIPGRVAVSVNGVSGWQWTDSSGRVSVAWEPSGTHDNAALTVTVKGVADPLAVSLRVARSVRPDGTDRFAAPISYGSMPKGWSGLEGGRVYGNSPQDVRTEAIAVRDRPEFRNSGMTLYAYELAPGMPTPSPIDGPATGPIVQVTPAPGVEVALVPVAVPNGTDQLDSEAEVQQISQHVHVDPQADVSWIGTP